MNLLEKININLFLNKRDTVTFSNKLKKYTSYKLRLKEYKTMKCIKRLLVLL